MDVVRSSSQLDPALPAPCVAIGNFDGVHRGHRALFAQALASARRESGSAIALTFDPHPARFFRPELAPPLIGSESQKLRLLADCGRILSTALWARSSGGTTTSRR